MKIYRVLDRDASIGEQEMLIGDIEDVRDFAIERIMNGWEDDDYNEDNVEEEFKDDDKMLKFLDSWGAIVEIVYNK